VRLWPHDGRAAANFIAEACALAEEAVERGWGGPFGAVLVMDGEVIGRGRTGCC
jgi:tRNA(Arg) A34 adenosine deaminase TadA